MMNELVQFGKYLYSLIRSDHQKSSNIYQHHGYESVDDRSLSQIMSLKSIKNSLWSIEC